MIRSVCALAAAVALVAGLPARAADPPKDYADRTKALLEAAEKGRVSLIVELLKKGADVNDKDDDGQAALHKAAAAGHKSVVVTLLAYGADMGEKDARGVTPMMAAAEAGNAEVLDLLLTPNKVSDLAGDALKSAGGVPRDATKLSNLLFSGRQAALTAADKSGQTVWHKAAAGGHADCVKALADCGAGGTAEQCARPDRQGKTPVMLAAAAGHDAVIDILAANLFYQPLVAECRRADKDGKTSAELAEAAGHRGIARTLRQAQAIRAAADGDAPTLLGLVSALGQDFPAVRAMGAAVDAGKLGVVQLLKEKWKDKPADEKRALLEGDGTTNGAVLFRAVTKDSAPMVRALLDRDWWKDPEALRDYITAKRNNSQINTDYYAKEYPQAFAAVHAVLKDLEGKK